MSELERDAPEDSGLRAAFDAAREELTGEHPEPDATLRRVLLATRAEARSRRRVRWYVLPIAAVLTASTAWAGANGKLAVVAERVRDAVHFVGFGDDEVAASRGSQRPAPSAGEPEVAAPPAEVASSAAEEESGVSEERETPPVVSAAPVAVASLPASPRAPFASSSSPATVPAPSEASAAAPTPSATGLAPDPHADLYAEAHRLHFAERDAARALVAWDRYLAAAPYGRFAPEARYNRALALVRLGREADARSALTAIADGALGGYRAAEARTLLEAMSKEQ